MRVTLNIFWVSIKVDWWILMNFINYIDIQLHFKTLWTSQLLKTDRLTLHLRAAWSHWRRLFEELWAGTVSHSRISPCTTNTRHTQTQTSTCTTCTDYTEVAINERVLAWDRMRVKLNSVSKDPDLDASWSCSLPYVLWRRSTAATNNVHHTIHCKFLCDRKK